jgi:predicted enzyme related to lactoylglutathione lyase
MPDPFEALRAPVSAVEPDPVFAANLRARIERALTLPNGVIVADLALDPSPPVGASDDLDRPRTSRPGPSRQDLEPPGIVPYICVRDARGAIDWYTTVLGARLVGEPVTMADGRIGHAELDFGGRSLYLSDESAQSNVSGPTPGEPATVTLMLAVDDVDETTDRAVGDGARLERPAANYPHGRNAVVRDPFGHRWMISGATGRPAAAVDTLRHGDVSYASLWVRDVVRAAAFFGHVLGWAYTPGSAPQGRQVEGTTPHHGMWGEQDHATLFLCFAVDDVDDALERVRAAGGEGTPPVMQPYGRVAECTDDQGLAFALVEAPPGAAALRGPQSGARQGDLAYVTIEVVDSAKARAFYGKVLGWRFTPGRADDGWGVDGTWPMTGLHGGNEHAVVVPMYRVDDVAVAVDRVRARGGTSTDPQSQPYGITATCTDDQGTRFYLGQL